MLLSNSGYLQIIIGGLSRDVLPELGGENARGKMQIALASLHDLIKREQQLPAIIAALAPEGVRLEARLADLRSQDFQESGPISSSAEFADLVRRLDEGAKALLAQAGHDRNADAAAWLHDAAMWEGRYYAAYEAAPAAELSPSGGEGQSLTAEKLQKIVQARLPDENIQIQNFVPVPGGFANHTYFFTLARAGQPDSELVVRQKDRDPFFTFWANRISDEFAIVSELSRIGLPVSKPLWLFENAEDIDGGFYIMTRAQGKIAGSLEEAYAGGRALSENLMLNLARFLGRLHSAPLSEFADYFATGDTPVAPSDSVKDAVTKNVAYMKAYWQHRSRLPSPSEAYMLDWLERNIPEDHGRPVVVHGDCFVHNLIVNDKDEINAVVDWESAHFGAPATDLAYIKDQVSLFISWDRFAEEYRRAGGPEVREADFPYYKALMNFRNSWGTNIGVSRIAHGKDDIRLASLGTNLFAAFLESSLASTRTDRP